MREELLKQTHIQLVVAARLEMKPIRSPLSGEFPPFLTSELARDCMRIEDREARSLSCGTVSLRLLLDIIVRAAPHHLRRQPGYFAVQIPKEFLAVERPGVGPLQESM
eukprot:CAMPEP_0181234868 /NCGR_PEP_ID=MMETSP1096-20121128/37228_1 /TAXON_ID=156174 ORGANISM="Chrysochromulina ericina, Strain CCMP281" /NCGR_SAMPLE_ID=MMETSP1096 /ASSEMBLY_ACC=CAM_ASM_000453 /LENGTH=107 /DNA_ID=CAMNT_0023329723 /DNA_START=457 /DNA_END=777 /DNA_ORIENTATION=+